MKLELSLCVVAKVEPNGPLILHRVDPVTNNLFSITILVVVDNFQDDGGAVDFHGLPYGCRIPEQLYS